MAQIFLSYASADHRRAAMLAEVLQEAGWSVWWDRAIPGGADFRDYIESALAEAQYVIVLWSRASVVSHWVRDEAAEAQKRRVLIPVAIENVLPPLGFRGLQTIDLHAWDGSVNATEFQVLARDLQRVIPISKESVLTKASDHAAETGELSSSHKRREEGHETATKGSRVTFLYGAAVLAAVALELPIILLIVPNHRYPRLYAGAPLLVNNLLLATATVALYWCLIVRSRLLLLFVSSLVAGGGGIVTNALLGSIGLYNLVGWWMIVVYNVGYSVTVVFVLHYFMHRRVGPGNRDSP